MAVKVAQLTEKQVLKKLNIPDFRHLSKDKIMTFFSMLPNMDPEVAKKAIEQFPTYAGTVKEIVSEYKGFLKKSLADNAESVQSYYAICNSILNTLSNMLEQDDLSFDEKKYIISCKYSEGAKGANDRDLSDITRQYKFVNMRAWLFWAVRDWLNPKNETGAMLPPDDRFDEEATEIKYSFRSDGRILIEPKDDIKKRIGRSPDLFDSLANTFYPLHNRQGIDLSRLAKTIRR